VRFLIDAQLPASLAAAIGKAGYEARHVAHIGLISASDKQIWERAKKMRAALLTKDQDLASLRQASKVGPAVVWIRIGNTTSANLTARLLRVLPEIVKAIEAGETVVEVK
jgi:predicted nuclease of predicted toxin-antitoxin system